MLKRSVAAGVPTSHRTQTPAIKGADSSSRLRCFSLRTPPSSSHVHIKSPNPRLHASFPRGLLATSTRPTAVKAQSPSAEKGSETVGAHLAAR